MRPKQLVTIVALLLVLALVVVVGLRRPLLKPAAPDTQPGAELASAEAEPIAAQYAPELAPTPAAWPDPALTGGIEGLYLQLSRALSFDLAEVRGLAATGASFYIAVVDPARSVGMVIQASREHYGVLQTHALELDGRSRVGGLHMGAAGLWVPLSGEGDDARSTIALLDPVYLEVQRSFQVDQRVRAVAQIGENELVGISESGDRLYAWNLKGRARRQAANLTGARYHDLAWVRGSLIAAGVLEEGSGAVLDVLDPESLTLLARHHVYARAAGGAWVTAGGFDAYGEQFFMLAEGGTRPSLFAYALLEGALDDYVPATRP